MHVIMTLR